MRCSSRWPGVSWNDYLSLRRFPLARPPGSQEVVNPSDDNKRGAAETCHAVEGVKQEVDDCHCVFDVWGNRS